MEIKMSKPVLFKHCRFLALCMLIFFVGCTHYYAPRQYPVRPEMVPEFSGSEAVTVVNGYTSPKDLIIGSQGAHTWRGDMQKWTATAVGLLQSELGKRGFNVTGGAPKELKLTITRANVYWGFAAIRCILSLKVETGHGYTQEYEGNNASGWTLYRACDGAVTKAVAAILKDKEILAYLKVAG
jgi:hypothetical protein